MFLSPWGGGLLLAVNDALAILKFSEDWAGKLCPASRQLVSDLLYQGAKHLAAKSEGNLVQQESCIRRDPILHEQLWLHLGCPSHSSRPSWASPRWTALTLMACACMRRQGRPAQLWSPQAQQHTKCGGPQARLHAVPGGKRSLAGAVCNRHLVWHGRHLPRQSRAPKPMGHIRGRPLEQGETQLQLGMMSFLTFFLQEGL